MTLQDIENSGGGNDFALDNIVFQKAYASTASVNVSVITASSAASVSVAASANPVSNGQSVTFTATPTNGGVGPAYQWSVGGVPVTNATNSTYTYVPADGDVVSCAMTSYSSCTTSTGPVYSSVTMSVYNIVNYWIGTNGTDWGTASNWTGGFVPVTGDNVIFSTTSTPYGDAKNNLILDVDRTIGNLTNMSSKALVIPPAKCLTVNGTITTNGASSPGSIYIQAYPDGTQQNGSLIFYNSQSSPVYGTVEMYSKAFYNSGISGTNKYQWQYFGIPVSSLVANPTFSGSYLRSWIEAGDKVSNHWVNMTNSSPLQAFTGYEITQPNATTIVFQGQLVNWDSNLGQMSYTSSALYQGQHFFANPYTAAIDITKLLFDGVPSGGTVYLYNTGSYSQWQTDSIAGHTSIQGAANAGQYISVPQAYAGVLLLPGQIASMQGVLVKAQSGSSTFNIPYSSVVKNTTLQLAPGVHKTTGSSDIAGLRVDVRGAHYSDNVWLFADDNSTLNFDKGKDGLKKLGSTFAPQFYGIQSDGIYQVNSVNDINGMCLGFQAGEDSVYTLTVAQQNIENKYARVYLVDSVANKTIDITNAGVQYVFEATSTPSPVNRFKILAQHYDSNASDSKIKVFSYNGTICVDNASDKNGQMMIYDVSGHLIKTMAFGANCITKYNAGLNQGVYVAKCSAESEQVANRIIIR